MSVTFTNQQEFTVDGVSIPTWDVDEMTGVEVIQVNGTTLRLRAYADAFFYDEYFEDVDDLYEDGGDSDLEIAEIECKFEFQIDFDIRNLSRDGSIRSLDFDVLNILDINYRLSADYANREINRSVLDREIYETLKSAATDSMYGIGRDGFTLDYSLS